MAMILRNQDHRSEIQSKVAAELQERLNSSRQLDRQDVEPVFLENQHATRSPGALIVVLLLALIAAVIWGATKL